MNFEKYKLSMLRPIAVDFKKITFGKPGLATHKLPVKTFHEEIQNLPEFIDDPVVNWFYFGMSAEYIVEILTGHNLSPELSFDVTGHREAVENWDSQNWEHHASEAVAAFEKDLLLECGVDDIPADIIRPVLELSRNGVSRFDYSEIASKFKSMVIAMTPMIEHYRATKS